MRYDARARESNAMELAAVWMELEAEGQRLDDLIPLCYIEEQIKDVDNTNG